MSLQGYSEIAKVNVTEMARRCKDFLVEILNHTEKRLSANEKIFQGLNYMNPRIVFSQIDLPLLISFSVATIITVAEEQYCQILHVDWASQDGKIPTNSSVVCLSVFKCETASGKKHLKTLQFKPLQHLPHLSIMQYGKEGFYKSPASKQNCKIE